MGPLLPFLARLCAAIGEVEQETGRREGRWAEALQAASARLSHPEPKSTGPADLEAWLQEVVGDAARSLQVDPQPLLGRARNLVAGGATEVELLATSWRIAFRLPLPSLLEGLRRRSGVWRMAAMASSSNEPRARVLNAAATTFDRGGERLETAAIGLRRLPFGQPNLGSYAPDFPGRLLRRLAEQTSLSWQGCDDAVEAGDSLADGAFFIAALSLLAGESLRLLQAQSAVLWPDLDPEQILLFKQRMQRIQTLSNAVQGLSAGHGDLSLERRHLVLADYGLLALGSWDLGSQRG
ncbi:MAG: hypothetical protein DWQ01_00035 [Planctomycetota bacterium]|nr:MAG: hypothetical protein DWQ01_00035 [Planctomycetota bacterium]